jgi:hypothetical protein
LKERTALGLERNALLGLFLGLLFLEAGGNWTREQEEATRMWQRTGFGFWLRAGLVALADLNISSPQFDFLKGLRTGKQKGGYYSHEDEIMSCSKNIQHPECIPISSHSTSTSISINCNPYFLLAKQPLCWFLQQPFTRSSLNRFCPEPLCSNRPNHHNIKDHHPHSPSSSVRRRHLRRRESKSFQWRRKLVRLRKPGNPP